MFKSSSFPIYNDEQIIHQWFGEFEIDEPYLSPLRDEKVGSLFFYYDEGKLKWKDHGLFNQDGNDAVSFVKALKKCSYKEAVKLINNGEMKSKKKPPKVIPQRKTKIVKYDCEFNNDHKEYWKTYGITCANDYNVKGLRKLYINGKKIYKAKYSFVYNFGPKSFKIYQPFFDTGKFMCKNITGIIEGKDQLQGGETLIITSSLKDVMVFRMIGIDAIAAHSETVKIDLKEFLNSGYSNIITYLDNDSTGKEASKYYSKVYGIKNYFVPEKEFTCPISNRKLKTKDPSDWVQAGNSLENIV